MVTLVVNPPPLGRDALGMVPTRLVALRLVRPKPLPVKVLAKRVVDKRSEINPP